MSAGSSVYGPVRSWRLGASLGIDLLCVDSICSFSCLYCQLGRINVRTAKRRVYVSTAQVMKEIRASDWRAADCLTLSGSGEPTLAANLGEVIGRLKSFTAKPVVVLTNASTLHDPSVRRELASADQVCCKLDTADERTFRMMNRPVAGLKLSGVIRGIKSFRKEYGGRLAIQIMLMRMNVRQTDELAQALMEIGPDEVQLNAPLRPVPHKWCREARGNDYKAPFSTLIRPISEEEGREAEARLRALTGLRIDSVYGRGKEAHALDPAGISS